MPLQSPHSPAATIAEQGLALCLTEQTVSEPIVQIKLPFLPLTVRSDSADYLALCRRALIDEPSYAAPEATPLHILVTDSKTRPEISQPDFDMPKLGLGSLIAACETADLCGSHDYDFGSWQFFDPATGRGIQLLAAPGAMPDWERAFPLRNFMHWAYAAQGRRLLHAGTLGLGQKGILLAGAGGAGKSGTTLAGIIHRLQSVGDDYIALDLTADTAKAFPVIKLMKQDPRGLSRLGLNPDLTHFGPVNWQGKHEFDFNALIQGSRADMLEIGAILLPKITGESRSKLRPATAHEVMFALLPNNLQQLPGQVKQALGFLARLTRQIPGYHLELGSSPHEIADTIRGFIERGMR